MAVLLHSQSQPVSGRVVVLEWSCDPFLDVQGGIGCGLEDKWH